MTDELRASLERIRALEEENRQLRSQRTFLRDQIRFILRCPCLEALLEEAGDE